MKLRQFIVRQKYRLDIGASVLSVGTFAIVASDKIKLLPGMSETRYSIAIGFVAGMAAVWIFGWVLDRFHYIQLYNREANARNEDIQTIKKSTENS